MTVISCGQLPVLTFNTAVALGDMDGDGDVDALMGSLDLELVGGLAGGLSLLLNDGQGNLTESGDSLPLSVGFGIALGDLDGDDDLDVFVAEQQFLYVVLQNDGQGNLTPLSAGPGPASSTDVELGDLDGDGDLDAFILIQGTGNMIWLNDGAGFFSNSGQILGDGASMRIALGDVDGDGDLDAFVINTDVANSTGLPNEVWQNDGQGNFTNSGQSLGNGMSMGIALGDMDGDDDLDAFVANRGPNKVWLNDGDGNYTDSTQNLGDSASHDIALGDLDCDDDLDAFVANGGTDLSTSAPNEVWLNDGAGFFTNSGESIGLLPSIGVALGDLDGDDDLDAFVTNVGLPEIWLNELCSDQPPPPTCEELLDILTNQLAQKDQTIADLNNQIAQKDQTIADLNNQIAQKDQTIADLNNQIAQKDQTITDLNNQIAQKDQTIADLNNQIAQKDQTIADLNNQIAQKDQTIADLNNQIAQKDQTIADLNNQIAQKDQIITDLNGQIAQKDQAIADLNEQLQELKDTYLDTMPPSGAVHAYDNLIWPANNQMVEVTLSGYVRDEVSILRDESGTGISVAFLIIDDQETIPLTLGSDGSFSVTKEFRAKKNTLYTINLFAADTNPTENGGPNSGIIDQTYVSVPSNMGK
jgi:uncharacterized coiled-coil protein SlyX